MWTKEMALEIISAGYKSVARKYHPDVGGKHEDMIALTETKEHLEKVMNGGSNFRDSNWSNFRDDARRAKERDEAAARRAREQRAKDDYKKRSQYWQQAGPSAGPGDIPIHPYEHDKDYYVLDDVTVMKLSDKAVKIKIPNVKEPQWLPKSQIHDDSEVCGDAGGMTIEGDVGYVIFTRWIAQQKGWLK